MIIDLFQKQIGINLTYVGSAKHPPNAQHILEVQSRLNMGFAFEDTVYFGNGTQPGLLTLRLKSDEKMVKTVLGLLKKLEPRDSMFQLAVPYYTKARWQALSDLNILNEYHGELEIKPVTVYQIVA